MKLKESGTSRNFKNRKRRNNTKECKNPLPSVKLRESVRVQKSMYMYTPYPEFKTSFNVNNGIAVHPWQNSHIHTSLAKVRIKH